MTLPRRFGRYLLVDRLAMGGMAEIYEARLIGVAGFEKTLAIKQILPHWSERQAFITMLIDEAKIAVRLNHPNIVEVYELGRERGQYYIAMELVEGIDLRELQRRCHVMRRRLPLQLALYIIQEVSQALHYAHQLTDRAGRPLELIHRDISPQNILISYEGRVKVTDFGIAKAVDSEHETVTGTFKGKFAYMSPEQASQLSIDQRSDLFSLGIVFYELITGQRLFQGKSDLEVLDRVREARLPPTDLALADLRPALRQLILDLLARHPDQRPRTAGDVLQRLQQVGKELELTPLRSALAAFVQDLFADRFTDQALDRQRQSSVVDGFLRQEATSSEWENRETTASVIPTEGTQILVDAWREFPSRLSAKRSLRWIVPGASLLLLIAAVLIWRLWPEAQISQTVSILVPEEQAVTSVTTPPVVDPERDVGDRDRAIGSAQAIGAQDPLATSKPPVRPSGQLSVQAIPWGYVYVDGSSKRLETPLRRLSLRPGPHQLKVVHQGSGEIVQRTIDIPGGKSVTCIAHFGEQRRIECR